MHNLINSEGFGFKVFFSLFSTLFFRLDQTLSIIPKVKRYIMWRLGCSEVKPIEKSDFEKIYLGIRSELDFYVIISYVVLLAGNYFYSCNDKDIIDCMGEPVPGLVKTEHYYLALCLVAITLVNIIVGRVAIKYNVEGTERFIPKINTIPEYIAMCTFFYGVNMNFSLPGLYTILKI